jgi:hypothetical protein
VELASNLDSRVLDLLENFLSNKWGDSWFEQCVVKENNYSRESKNDLNFLTRQILDLNNQNFRLAIAMTLFQKSHIEKPHLDALENVRKSRNFWAHPNREITSRDLNKLALSVVAIVPAHESLAKKCSESLTISEKQGHLSKIADLTSFKFSEIFSFCIGILCLGELLKSATVAPNAKSE